MDGQQFHILVYAIYRVPFFFRRVNALLFNSFLFEFGAGLNKCDRAQTQSRNCVCAIVAENSFRLNDLSIFVLFSPYSPSSIAVGRWCEHSVAGAAQTMMMTDDKWVDV